MDEIELGMHQLLDDTDHRWTDSRQIRAAEGALYLSILGVGAQFADATIGTREKLSQNLSRPCSLHISD